MSRLERYPFTMNVLFVMIGVGLLFLYWPTLTWLGQQWLGAGPFSGRAQDWSHGPLVVALLIYLLWRRWRDLSVGGGASFWGMPLILAGLGFYGAGTFLQAPYLSAYSLIPLTAGLVGPFWGARAVFRLLLILTLFALAVPFPAVQWGLVGFLQEGVATSSAFLAGVIGTPVHRSGLLVTVGDVLYLVAPLCSGFNWVMALLALVLPLLFLQRASLKTVGGALLWVPALALGTKVLLVSLIFMLTPSVGPDQALVLYHRWLGVPFFLASLTIAVLVIRIMSPGGRLRTKPIPQ